METDLADVYKILFTDSQACRIIRANLSQEIILTIRNIIKIKYTSFMKMAEKENFPYCKEEWYTPLKTWLRENKKYRSAIPLYQLKKVMTCLGIEFEKILQKIESFQVWSGKAVKLPRFIKVDYDFVYGLGLYISEGKNERKQLVRVSIANSEESIVNFAMHWLTNYFLVSIDDIKFYIISPLNLKQDCVKREISNLFQVSKRRIHIQKNRFAKILTVEVSYDSKVIRMLIEWFKNNINEFTLSNPILAKAFLQGIFDGEAHVRKRRYQIIVEMKNPKIIDLCQILLKKVGIAATKREDKSNGTNVLGIWQRDFLKIKEVPPFRFNKYNKDIFERKCLKLQQCNRALKF